MFSVESDVRYYLALFKQMVNKQLQLIDRAPGKYVEIHDLAESMVISKG